MKTRVLLNLGLDVNDHQSPTNGFLPESRCMAMWISTTAAERYFYRTNSVTLTARLVDQNGLKPQRLVKTAPGMPDLAGETIYESEKGLQRNRRPVNEMYEEKRRKEQRTPTQSTAILAELVSGRIRVELVVDQRWRGLVLTPRLGSYSEGHQRTLRCLRSMKISTIGSIVERRYARMWVTRDHDTPRVRRALEAVQCATFASALPYRVTLAHVAPRGFGRAGQNLITILESSRVAELGCASANTLATHV
ncbi:hypothetical protein B0H13DRAFT_1883890 [Mycena leptocephala]|nr:hypothetical protein B0H13DRAFT_1883890 [Mycena leptocephala]